MVLLPSLYLLFFSNISQPLESFCKQLSLELLHLLFCLNFIAVTQILTGAVFNKRTIVPKANRLGSLTRLEDYVIIIHY